MGACRIFSRGVQTQRLVKNCRSYLSSVYLWNTNTCCRISLCRIESDTLHLPAGALVREAGANSKTWLLLKLHIWLLSEFSNQGKSLQINEQASDDVWCGSLDTDKKRGRTIGKGRDENATMDTRSIIAG